MLKAFFILLRAKSPHKATDVGWKEKVQEFLLGKPAVQIRNVGVLKVPAPQILTEKSQSRRGIFGYLSASPSPWSCPSAMHWIQLGSLFVSQPGGGRSTFRNGQGMERYRMPPQK